MTKRPILSGILGGATLSTLPVVLQEMTPSNLVIFVLNPLEVDDADDVVAHVLKNEIYHPQLILIVLQVAITPPHPGGGGFAIMIFW